MQLTRQHDLALGDIAGQVGNGMGHVVVGHGHDHQLSHRSRPTMNTAGPFVDRRQVGVHVSGVAASTRHLLAGRRHLAQGLAVVRHVGEDHEHVEVPLEGEVLGDGQRHPRREQSLDRRIVGQIEEQDGPVELSRLLQVRTKEGSLAMRDAHCGEDDHEVLMLGATDRRSCRDIGGELIGRQSEPREDRQLLTAHQRVEPVDRRDAGLDELGRIATGRRIDRQPVHVPEVLRHDGGAAIDRHTRAVEHPPEDIEPNSDPSRVSSEPHPG